MRLQRLQKRSTREYAHIRNIIHAVAAHGLFSDEITGKLLDQINAEDERRIQSTVKQYWNQRTGIIQVK